MPYNKDGSRKKGFTMKYNKSSFPFSTDLDSKIKAAENKAEQLLNEKNAINESMNKQKSGKPTGNKALKGAENKYNIALSKLNKLKNRADEEVTFRAKKEKGRDTKFM